MENNSIEVTAQPADERVQAALIEALSSAANVPSKTVSLREDPVQQTAKSTSPSAVIVDDTSFRDFKAGDTDPQKGVVIKEILVKTDGFIVYIDNDLCLHWHWNEVLDPASAAAIFNRVCELQAKSEFLRQTSFRKRDLISSRRLIGEGLVVLFCTQSQAFANAALDTADKFITQIGRETSRGWYFGPFFVFFAISTGIGLTLYLTGQKLVTTLPLVCCLAGGIGAFISTALGNERIPCAPTAGRFLHLLEALLRYTIGFAAGLLIWLAVSGNIAIGFLNFANNTTASLSSGSVPSSVYALIATAILGGASERLLPSLIATFDESTKKQAGSPTGESVANESRSQPSSTPPSNS